MSPELCLTPNGSDCGGLPAALEHEPGTPLSLVQECHVECDGTLKQVSYLPWVPLHSLPRPRVGGGSLTAVESEQEAEDPSAEERS